MLNPIICCLYSHTPEGDNALAFAADLKRRLPGSKLQVFLCLDAKSQELVTGRLGSAGWQGQLARVKEAVENKTGLPAGEVEVKQILGSAEQAQFPRDAIVVDRNFTRSRRHDVAVLAPFDETRLDCRGEGVFLLPFGAGESGMHAAKAGLGLARAIGKKVVFYHTTWRNEKLVLWPEPADHMCQDSRAVRQSLEAFATELNIPFETRIEMANDVAEGIVRCAMRVRANLICMARGVKTGLGSYVTQVLDQSPVPVLVAGR